jgi:hypothetical protein
MKQEEISVGWARKEGAGQIMVSKEIAPWVGVTEVSVRVQSCAFRRLIWQ